MNDQEKKNNKDAEQLADEEIKTVTGGMKVVVNEEKSWWRSLLDLFFKIKS